MKTFYILFVAIFSVNCASAQWIQQISGTNNNLNSVYFTDVSSGYVVGDTGIILKTINGGENWVIKNSGTSNNLYSIYFPNPDTGYAVGEGSIILKTLDKGENWINQNAGIWGNFRSTFFIHSDTGFVFGGSEGVGIILKTTDGGSTWTLVYTSDTIFGGINSAINSVYFPNSIIGYAVGSFIDSVGSFHSWILKTSDGGINWMDAGSGISKILNSVYFTNENTGYIVGSKNPGKEILKTINGGINWTSYDFGGWNVGSLQSVFFTDANTGYSIGSGGSGGWKTTDSGSSWNTQEAWGNSVYFPVIDTGYIVGWDGTIFKTTNGGGYVGLNDHSQPKNTLTIFPNPVSSIKMPQIQIKYR